MNRDIDMQTLNDWSNKNNYMNLMEKFIKEKINGIEFDREFCGMWKEARDKISKIDNEYDIDLSKLEDFSSLISELFTDCDIFEPNFNLREDYEISEEELFNRVKKTFLEIKYFYLED